MKKICFTLLLVLFGLLSAEQRAQTPFSSQQIAHLFSLSATSTWREYPLNIPQITMQKEKWAWTCSLIFKSKWPVKLTQLKLQWKGGKIEKLSAGLYQKKERDCAVIPIEENLIGQGIWNAADQQLVFNLDEKVVAVNKYYLMLSFPKKLEPHIKTGRFVISCTQLSHLYPTG